MVYFQDVLNTFYLWLYCVGHIAKDYIKKGDHFME